MEKKNYSFGMADAPKDFGNPPDLDPSDVYQYHPDTCAIRSQELILKDFGIDISQEDLIQQAIDHGWYEPGQGTSPLDVGKLLELNGVPVHQYENGNIFSLVNELAQGHKIIVGVDADELWFDEPDWFDNAANHALLVSNIDTTDPNNITVTLTDPGTGDVAKVYSFEQFELAWRDSNCFICATQDPVPLTADYMCNFDYETGHLDTVFNGTPFEDFQAHFGSVFDMDVNSETFKEILINLANDPQTRILVSSIIGYLVNVQAPGAGVPTTLVINNAWKPIIKRIGLSDDRLGGLVDPEESGTDDMTSGEPGGVDGGDLDGESGPYDDSDSGQYDDTLDTNIDDGGVDDFGAGDMGGIF